MEGGTGAKGGAGPCTHPQGARTAPLLCSAAAAPLGLGQAGVTLPAGTLRAQVCRAEVGAHQHHSCLVWDLRSSVCQHHVAFVTGRAQLKRSGNAALLEPKYPCMSEEDKESG